MKKQAIICLVSFCLITTVLAETIALKSGAEVEGKIIEKTDTYIKIDFQGVILTYFTDEIENIDAIFGTKTHQKITPEEPRTITQEKPMHVWQPTKTIALLIGVLQWQDQTLETYDPRNRQDQKLFETLIERGVPKENIIFLKDKEATLLKILETFKSLARQGDTDSTFFFYYAGHGKKSEDGRKAYFLNYDYNPIISPILTAFMLDNIAKILKENFKGREAILTADCCYSGTLNQIADELSEAGIETLVLSSASASNISTGAWTFTQSLVEILKGTPLMVLTQNDITVKNAAEYITYNMAYEENQYSNIYMTARLPQDFVLAKNEAKDFIDKNYIGQYKLAQYNGKDYKVRIIDQHDNSCRIHYLGWGSEWDEWRDYNELKDIEFKTYNVNTKVLVKWNKTWYPAVVFKREGIFHLIKYDDYDNSWNEWVTSERIKIN
ncbi:MAG: caspase family protein [Candidatus Omnitrophota bacterium]|nr:caspase family protein [Candidatus Omnitrophota bacterium]